MKTVIPFAEPILMAGSGQLSASVAICLMAAGHPVKLFTAEPEDTAVLIATHMEDLREEGGKTAPGGDKIRITDSLEGEAAYQKAIIISPENLSVKKAAVRALEEKLPAGAVIAVNMEGIRLEQLQEDARHPERIMGLNWTEPAHTTRFLEFIENDVTKEDIIHQWCQLAEHCWYKDPYVVRESGIRSRLMSAMAREAFYLVENGFASIEDIDRACRNDAGYYLPFAGNCRYMDLMGTAAYGKVMKDLNPDLSKAPQLPVFFTDIVHNGGAGMKNGKGLYEYTGEDKKNWGEVFRRFSYQIRKIIEKYPFNYE